MTALVGHSGSGKSTMLNMIPRIYSPIEGSIEIDDQDISKINLNSLRKEISIVDQNTTLFDDTVLNNIRYAKPDASLEEIYEAANNAMCRDFIENLENKYETMIGENGVKLSGGEKQRLSIARAFLKKSKIILLDEATSSLDSETEEKIQEALGKLVLNKTTIVIAHRLSTILNSDNIYVVDDGKIVEQRFVKLGRTKGDLVSIVEGIAAGEEIVTAGAFKLSNGRSIVVNNSSPLPVSLNPTPDDA